jgi:hypothetical protein
MKLLQQFEAKIHRKICIIISDKGYQLIAHCQLLYFTVV